MMNRNVSFFTACLFLAATLFAGSAVIASTTCKVVSVQGTNVTLDCGDDATDYKTGIKVSIKKKKVRKAIEGC